MLLDSESSYRFNALRRESRKLAMLLFICQGDPRRP
jgi:hypothetical protein